MLPNIGRRDGPGVTAVTAAAARSRLTALLAPLPEPPVGPAGSVTTLSAEGDDVNDAGSPNTSPGRGPGVGPGRGLGRAATRALTLVMAVVVTAGVMVMVRSVLTPAPTVSAPTVLASGIPVVAGASTPPAPSLTPAPTSGPGSTVSGELVVHVIGPVRQPGVVRLPAGSRVIDAIEAAGGVRPGRSTGGINLARLLVDGEQIIVGAPAAGTAAPGATPESSTAAVTPGSFGTLVDLNTATQEQIEELPGIGPVLAAAILAWRDEHGGFRSIDELAEVPGIGETRLAQLTPLVRV